MIDGAYPCRDHPTADETPGALQLMIRDHVSAKGYNGLAARESEIRCIDCSISFVRPKPTLLLRAIQSLAQLDGKGVTH